MDTKVSEAQAVLSTLFHTAAALAELHDLPELHSLAYLAELASKTLEG